MFGIFVLFLGFLFWLANLFFSTHTARLAFVFGVFTFCVLPLFNGYSLCTFVYSFFDSPSVFCILLVGFFVAGQFYLGLGFKSLGSLGVFTHKAQDRTFFLFFIFGSLLYISSLNLLWFDLYHTSPIAQAVSVVIFVILIGIFDRFSLVLLSISLAIFILCGLGFSFLDRYYNLSIFEFIICPYLWFYSLFYSMLFLVRGIQKTWRKL